MFLIDEIFPAQGYEFFSNPADYDFFKGFVSADYFIRNVVTITIDRDINERSDVITVVKVDLYFNASNKVPGLTESIFFSGLGIVPNKILMDRR